MAVSEYTDLVNTNNGEQIPYTSVSHVISQQEGTGITTKQSTLENLAEKLDKETICQLKTPHSVTVDREPWKMKSTNLPLQGYCITKCTGTPYYDAGRKVKDLIH